MSTEAQASTKTWELSLYERNRTPQEALTDNTEIAVSPRSLHSELMCPICLDMLKNTMTTKECLHRFCYDCIITALRSGNKECPTCRKKLVSKRSLRADPNFDALIAKIYPCRDEYEAHQERVLAKLNKQIAPGEGGGSVGGGGLRASLKKKNASAANASGVAPTEEPAEAETAADNSSSPPPGNSAESAAVAAAHSEVDNAFQGLSLSAQPGPSGANKSKISSRSEMDVDMDDYSEMGSPASTVSVGEVELIFKPHPDDAEKWRKEREAEMNAKNAGTSTAAVTSPGPEAADRFIRTTGNATVDHLSKYLAMRLALEKKARAATDNGDEPSLDCDADVGADEENYAISISSPSDNSTQIPLNGNWTLDQVHDRYWKSNRPLEMFYKIVK